jgi:zinc/manganese transport system substrate-binding protein
MPRQAARFGPGPAPCRHLRHTAGVVAAAALVLTACASSSRPATTEQKATGRRVIQVVAAENFWGSIASQIGGKHAQVKSIITKPNTDPHSYEPTAIDARALARAHLVVENGIGYDPWVPKLLAADQNHPRVLDVGRLLDVPRGGNPHRWYNPANVQSVIRQLVTDFQALDPVDSVYFAEQQTSFDAVALRQYRDTITSIRANYSGTPVGASESIFAMLAPALGLDLITPASFLQAISEGTDVSAADKETIDHQIKDHAIKIYVYNSQNVTPDVRAQLEDVKAEHIPYAGITETLAPAGATYQAWQTRQLLGMQTALAAAAPDTGGSR